QRARRGLRAVEELAVGRDVEIGGRRLALEIGRQGADALLFLELSGRRVVVEHVDGRIELTEHVDELAVRMEGEMSRAGLFLHADGRGRARRQHAGGGVEPEHVDEVVPERQRDDVPIARVGEDRVSIRVIRQDLVRRQHGARRSDRVHVSLWPGYEAPSKNLPVRSVAMYAMLSASGPLATCLSRPLAGSMANPTASFGSPRVPT